MDYLTVKWIHIVSASLLFGTGLGSAFYKWRADKSNNIHAIAFTNNSVVLADWLVTTPTIIIQPVTGYWLATQLQLSITEPWMLLAIILYLIAGLCWLPVVWLQIKMSQMAQQAVTHNSMLDKKYRHYKRIWLWLGVPAFSAMIGIFALMTMKPSLQNFIV